MEVTKALIENFLADRCTDQEAEAVSKYFNAHPEEIEKYLPLSDWEDIKQSKPALPKEVSNNIRRRFDLGPLNNQPKKTPSFLSIRFKRRLLAACVFLLVVAGLFIYENCGRQLRHNDGTIFTAHSDAQLLTDDTCINNLRDHTLEITMPDGSTLLLSQNSSIQFSKIFIPRKIKLKGECYFNVTHDSEHPFTVISGATETSVLGTSFTISELERKGAIRFDVFTGKILVKIQKTQSADKTSIFLPSGKSMRFDTKTNTASMLQELTAPGTKKVLAVTSVNYIKQTDQQIDFDHAPLALVFEILQEYYNINIDFKNQPLDNLHFTGTILKSLPIQRVIDHIAVINNLLVQPEADGFIISKLNKSERRVNE